MYGPYLPHLEWANFLQNQSVAPLFRAKQRLRKRSRHSRDPENTPHKFSGYSSCEALHELLSTRIPKLGCAEDGRFGPGCGSPRTSKPTTAASRRSPGVQTKETKEETRTTPKQPSVGTMVRGFGLALVSVRMPRSLMRSVLDWQSPQEESIKHCYVNMTHNPVSLSFHIGRFDNEWRKERALVKV